MSLFAKLFNRTLPTPEMAAADLATHLYQMANTAEGSLGLRDIDPRKSGVALQEILLAYVNLADRSLFDLFGAEIRDRGMQHIDELLPQSVTESLCHAWPEDLKTKHILEFAENMRSAEIEYGSLTARGLPREDDLFMKCALNVMAQIGQPNPHDKALRLCMVLMRVTTEMDMLPHVRKFGETLRRAHH